MKRTTGFEAVVWDMDGMLLDTERLAMAAWGKACEELQLDVSDAFFHSLIGRPWAVILESLDGHFATPETGRLLAKHAGVHYDRAVTEGPPLKRGALACLQLVKALGAPQALATSSSRELADHKLAQAELAGYFDASVAGDEVTQGKPHPEPYLTAAAKLGVAPERCIAFEDSANGIIAAHAAGMTTILVPDLCPHDAASLACVHHRFEHLDAAQDFLRLSLSDDAV